MKVKTTIIHQVEIPLSEKNIDPCDLINLMSIKLFQRLGKLLIYPTFILNIALMSYVVIHLRQQFQNNYNFLHQNLTLPDSCSPGSMSEIDGTYLKFKSSVTIFNSILNHYLTMKLKDVILTLSCSQMNVLK